MATLAGVTAASSTISAKGGTSMGIGHLSGNVVACVPIPGRLPPQRPRASAAMNQALLQRGGVLSSQVTIEGPGASGPLRKLRKNAPSTRLPRVGHVRRRESAAAACERGPVTVRSSMAGGATSVGVFRAGQKRPEVVVPALTLFVDSQQCSQATEEGQKYLALIDSAVAGGVTMVVLEASEAGQESAGQLFESACCLKEVLRGRAPLLIWERADIAAAAGAEGVLLSDRGLPAVAARRMMEVTAKDALVLPLVGRLVSSIDGAKSASAGEGADLILLSLPKGVAPPSGAPEAGTRTNGSALEDTVWGQGAESAAREGESRDWRTRLGTQGGATSSGEASGSSNWASSAVAEIRAAQVTVPLLLDLRKPIGAELRALGSSGAGPDDGVQRLGSFYKGSLDTGASGVALQLADVAELLSDVRGQGPRAAVNAVVASAGVAEGSRTEQESRADTGTKTSSGSVDSWQTDTETLQAPASSSTSSSPWDSNTGGNGGMQSASSSSLAERPLQTETAVSSVSSPTPLKPPPQPLSPLERLKQASPMDSEALGLIEAEKDLLSSFLSLLRKASPQMAEINLLADALARLADPFLVVIVGEFNSGKSSLINALLGGKFLKVGAVPTTNEITLIRHTSENEDWASGGEQFPASSVQQQVEQKLMESLEKRHPDGHIIRFLPSDLLKQVNIVDTPGTNVILERQQRLTEEFVPQADIVLFILSADRPLTDSEVSFLRYIRQWGKKVVFVLNKIDLLSEEDGEIDAVYNFVCDNVKRLLGADTVSCFPVSSRLALSSKTRAPDSDPVTSWKASRFEELEGFVSSFLEGSTGAGAERLRLKLDTPLGVGAALLAACERQLAEEREAAEADVQALRSVGPQMTKYREAMEADSELQLSRIVALVEEARSRADAVVDETLQAGNLDVLSQYLLAPAVAPDSQLPVLKSFQTQVVGSSFNDVRRSLYEHFEWLQSNNERQLASYKEFASRRWPALSLQVALSSPQSSQETEGNTGAGPKAPSEAKGVPGVGGSYSEGQEKRPGQESGQGDAGAEEAGSPKEEGERASAYPELQTVAALDGFDTGAAALLLEEELRLAVVGLATGVGAAGVSASVLTSMFTNPLEDLLALTLSAAGGSLGVLRLPAKREEVKKKIRRASQGLVKQLQEKLNQELDTALLQLQAQVDDIMRPYSQAADAELERVTALQGELQEFSKRIDGLRQRARNIGA